MTPRPVPILEDSGRRLIDPQVSAQPPVVVFQQDTLADPKFQGGMPRDDHPSYVSLRRHNPKLHLVVLGVVDTLHQKAVENLVPL